MELEELEKAIEISKEIDSLEEKLKVSRLNKCAFRFCCSQLSLFKKIMQTQNVKGEEINFEIIFNHFQEFDFYDIDGNHIL